MASDFSPEIRQILYDLHKENRQDIKEVRELVQQLAESFKMYKTAQKAIATAFGLIGGAIITISSIVVPVLAKHFF